MTPCWCKELQKRDVELVCLAGFMRIITPVLIKCLPEPDPEHPPFPAPGLPRPPRAEKGAWITA